LGLGLRCGGLTWGLPSKQHYYSYHPDEIDTVYLPVVSLSLAGEKASADGVASFFAPWDLNFYKYGSLQLYQNYLVTKWLHAVGILNLSATGEQFYEEMGKATLACRWVTVFFSLALLFAVFWLGSLLHSREAALLAALLCAVAPILCVQAHYATVDTQAAFWVTLALCLVVRALQTAHTKHLVFGGLSIGLAAGTKYNMAVALVPLLYSCWKLKAPLRWWLISVGASVLAFVVATPGSIFATKHFLRDFLFELRHTASGHGEVFLDTPSGFIYHLTTNFPYAVTWPVTVLFALAVVWAIFCRKPEFTVLLLFCATYYLVIGQAEVKFMRYVIPLVPSLSCMLAALFEGALGDAQSWFGPVGRGVVGGLLLGALIPNSLQQRGYFTRVDARDQAAEYLHHEPRANRNSVGLTTTPWFYTPPLNPNNAGERSADAFYAKNPPWKYNFVITGFDADKLRASKPDVFVISDFEMRYKARRKDVVWHNFEKTLRELYPNVAKFGPKLLDLWKPEDAMYQSPTIWVYSKN
jgi:hypothetical protein